MHANESTPDRTLRAVLGTVLLAIALTAGVALLTAAIGF